MKLPNFHRYVFTLIICNLRQQMRVSPQECDEEAYQPCNAGDFLLDAITTVMCVKILLSNAVKFRHRQTCELTRRGQLIEIRNERVQAELLRKLKPYGNHDYYINLLYYRRSFRWASTVTEELVYERNSVTPTTMYACAAINGLTGEWVTRRCSDALRGLCMNYESTDPIDPYARPRMFANVALYPNIVDKAKNVIIGCGDIFAGAFGTFIYRFGSDEYTLDSVNVTFKYSYEVDFYDNSCRRKISAILTLNRHEVKNDTGTVTCFTHDRTQKDIVIDQYKVKSYTFRHGYVNRPPDMVAEYHGEPPIVHLYRWFKVTCRGCVGLNGNISWAIRTPNGSISPLSDGSYGAKYRSESRDCGVYVISAIRLYVTPLLKRRRIICESYLDPHSRNNLETVQTRILITDFGPDTPTMVVRYHKDPSTIFLGRNLSASCSACVGSLGNIEWSVVSDNNSTDSDDRHLPDLHILQEFIEDVNHTDCNNFYVSRIVVKVTRNLHGMQLVCESYDGSYIEGVVLRALSKVFVVESPSDLDDDDDLGGGDPPLQLGQGYPILIGILVTLIVLLASREVYIRVREWWAEREQQKNTEKMLLESTTETSWGDTLTTESHVMPLPGYETEVLQSSCVDTGEKKHDAPEDLKLAWQLLIPVEEARKRLLAMKKEKNITEQGESRDKKRTTVTSSEQRQEHESEQKRITGTRVSYDRRQSKNISKPVIDVFQQKLLANYDLSSPPKKDKKKKTSLPSKDISKRKSSSSSASSSDISPTDSVGRVKQKLDKLSSRLEKTRKQISPKPTGPAKPVRS